MRAGRRHILLRHFPVPLFHSEHQSDSRRDAATPFWPQRHAEPDPSRSDAGPSGAVSQPGRDRGPGAVTSRTWGLKESKAPPLPAPAPRAPSGAQSQALSGGGRGCKASRPRPSISSRGRVEAYGTEGPVPGSDARDLRPPGGAR